MTSKMWIRADLDRRERGRRAEIHRHMYHTGWNKDEFSGRMGIWYEVIANERQRFTSHDHDDDVRVLVDMNFRRCPRRHDYDTGRQP